MERRKEDRGREEEEGGRNSGVGWPAELYSGYCGEEERGEGWRGGGRRGRDWCWMMRVGSCAHVSRFLWRGGQRREAGRKRREGLVLDDENRELCE